MPEFKLSKVKDLFPQPEKTAKLEKEDKKTNYGQIFQLSDDKKKNVIQYLKDCVNECKRQREGWLTIREECQRNREGMKKHSGPWDGSSNISTMVTTISSDLVHSKLFPMIWNPELIFWKGEVAQNEDAAENNRIFGKWIFTKDMPDTEDNVDEIIGRLIDDGTIAVKRVWEKIFVYVTRIIPTSFDDKGKIKYDVVYDKIKKERARWQIKDVEHVFFPYNCKNEDDAEYIIDEIFYTLPMLKEMQARKLILNDVDFDDIKLAVEKIIDPEGAKRIRLEAGGISPYTDRIESTPIRCYEGYVKYDINDDGNREECIFLALPDFNIYLSGKPLHVVSRIGKRPWKIGQFIRRWGASLGKGIPELVRHLHTELDAVHNQRIDAGNMVIAPPFGYRAASGFDPKKISIRPATGIPLDDPERDLKFFDINPSRLSVSFQEENIIMDLISKLTYMSAANFGQETANRPTARGTLAIIAQTEQKFTLIAGRVLKIVMDLITDTRKMYEEHWDNDYAKKILDQDGKQQWGNLSPEMIAGDFIAFSEVDLESVNSSFEKQAAQVRFQTLYQSPLVNQNPAFSWELHADYIKSTGKNKVEDLIGPKPDYENNPGIVSDENLMLLQEQHVSVNPKDDDVAHMNGHSKFKREMVSILTTEAMANMTQHILEHRFQYQQKLQQMALIQAGGENAQQGENANSGVVSTPGMGSIQGPNINTGQQPQVPALTGSASGGQGGGQY